MGHYYALSATNNAEIWLVEKKTDNFVFKFEWNWQKLNFCMSYFSIFDFFGKKQISNSENSLRVDYDNGFFY